MSDETKVTQEYGGSQIQVLEGLEAVRGVGIRECPVACT